MRNAKEKDEEGHEEEDEKAESCSGVNPDDEPDIKRVPETVDIATRVSDIMRQLKHNQGLNAAI